MKNYFKTIKLIFSIEKTLLIKVILVMLLVLGIEGGIPIYMNWMLGQIDNNSDIKTFILYVTIFAISYLIYCVIDSIRAGYNELLGKQILWNTREKIYNVLWKSDYLKNISNNKDRFKFVLSNETYTMFALVSVFSINLVLNFLTILVLFIIVLSINPIISLILLLSIGLTLGLSFYSGNRILKNYEKFDNAKEQDATMNIETVDMVEIARINGLEKYYLEKNKEYLNSFIDFSAKADSTEAFWTDLEKAVHALAYVLIAGIMMLTAHNVTGELVSILFIANIMLEFSRSFQNQLQVLIKNFAVFDKVASVSEISVNNGDEINSINSIEFTDIDVEYTPKQKVLNGFNYKIQSGDHVLIEGTNGSGKSTLIKMLIGLVTPTSGEILINGENLQNIDSSSLYKEVCYVSQDELLLNENVDVYLSEVTHKKLSKDLLERLKKFVKLKDEVNLISENGDSLSGGEKKKLQMMKLLIREDASVYILDEVDAGLDTETRRILKLVEDEIMKKPEHIVIKISHIDEEKSKYNKVISL